MALDVARRLLSTALANEDWNSGKATKLKNETGAEEHANSAMLDDNVTEVIRRSIAVLDPAHASLYVDNVAIEEFVTKCHEEEHAPMKILSPRGHLTEKIVARLESALSGSNRSLSGEEFVSKCHETATIDECADAENLLDSPEARAVIRKISERFMKGNQMVTLMSVGDFIEWSYRDSTLSPMATINTKTIVSMRDECFDYRTLDLPDLSEHHSTAMKILYEQPHLWVLKNKKTRLGVTFFDCIRTGLGNKGHPLITSLGCVAGDDHSYDTF